VLISDTKIQRDKSGVYDDQLSCNSAHGTGLGGIGKKRTYKELERWDIQGTKSQKAFGADQDSNDARSTG
jgi:hypothetical protein